MKSKITQAFDSVKKNNRHFLNKFIYQIRNR